MPTYTQAQYAALVKAIGTGARSISYDGKTTTFRDPDEMESLAAKMEAQLNGKARTGASVAGFSKGLGSSSG